MDTVTKCSNSDVGIVETFDKAMELRDENPTESERLLRECIDKGCTDSMVALGNVLSNGTDEQKSESLELFKKAGDLGHISGLRNAGYAIAIGVGCEVDKLEASKWYTRAAEAGHPKAQCNIGVFYDYGNGVDQDPVEAAKWFKLSAENGYSRGQTNYGEYLMTGRGVEKDTKEAAKWFAESGSNRAKFHLAELYLVGDGVPENREIALELLQDSSDGGYSKSKALLGKELLNEDREKAIDLFNQAAERGNKDAIDALNELSLPVPELKKWR